VAQARCRELRLESRQFQVMPSSEMPCGLNHGTFSSRRSEGRRVTRARGQLLSLPIRPDPVYFSGAKQFGTQLPGKTGCGLTGAMMSGLYQRIRRELAKQRCCNGGSHRGAEFFYEPGV